MKSFTKIVLMLCCSVACIATLNAATSRPAEPQDQQTDQKIDLKIQGDGYFQVTDPETGEILYTRIGNLSIDDNGQFCVGNTSAHLLLDPAITIPLSAASVGVDAEGLVSVQEAGSTTVVTLNNIQLAKFDNPLGLSPRGDNLFSQTDASGKPTENVPGANGLGPIQPVRWSPRIPNSLTK